METTDSQQVENNGETRLEETVTVNHLIRREPIIDSNQSLVGYRMQILCDDQTDIDTDDETVNDCGEKFIATARAIGINAFLGYLPHWIKGTPGLVKNAFSHTLPRNRAYVEIPADLEFDEELITAFKNLANSGIRFSIRGDVALKPELAPLIPHVKVVGYDPAISTKAEIFKQSFPHKQEKRLLMGVNTPDKAQLDNFNLIGFTLYEGNYPKDQVPLTSLTRRQKTLLNLVTLVMGDGEIPQIQAAIAQDSNLVETLLNMVNTPAYGLEQEVTSLNQAIMLLGRKQLQRWIQILMYTDAERPKGYLSPILIQASARAHLMEHISELRFPDQHIRADTAFTTGILSTMDQIFNGTMQDLIGQVQVDVPVRKALLTNDGPLGEDIRLAKLVFPSFADPIENASALLQSMDLKAEQVNTLIQDAFTWAHGITTTAS